MMLDADFLWDVRVECVFRCQVFGVQIISDCFGVDIEETLVMFNPLTKRGQRLQIL